MIEIRITLSLTLNSPHQDISSFEDVMKEHYTELHDFFKNQLQQNLILNCFKVDEVVSPQLISSYFATSTENAQAFVDAAFDTSALFLLLLCVVKTDLTAKLSYTKLILIQ